MDISQIQVFTAILAAVSGVKQLMPSAHKKYITALEDLKLARQQDRPCPEIKYFADKASKAFRKIEQSPSSRFNFWIDIVLLCLSVVMTILLTITMVFGSNQVQPVNIVLLGAMVGIAALMIFDIYSMRK